MALNNTYFETKGRDVSVPIPDTPGYVPPDIPTPVTPDPGSVPSIPRPIYSGELNVQFYINYSDEDTLDKNIETFGDMKTITIKGSVNARDFEIPFNDTSCGAVNYAGVAGRYYFCVPIYQHGALTSLHFTHDPLMTYNSAIKQCYAIIDRTGNSYNTYLNDPEMKITAYNNIHRLQSTSGFSKTLHYYLLAIGGSAVTP